MKRFFLKTKYWIIISLILAAVSCSKDDNSNNNDKSTDQEEEVIGGPTTEPVTDPPATTYGNITWKNWYLSVPINRGDGSATSIEYEAIESNNFTSAESKYIKENEDGSYNLFAEFTGYTTSGLFTLNAGRYCRTELREYWKGNQTTSDNWFMDEGTHVLESTLKVVECQGDNDCIVAQIHGKESATAEGSPATIKIRWRDGDIVVDYYTAAGIESGTNKWTSGGDKKTTIGTVGNDKFTVQLKVENGVFYFGLVCEAKNIDTGYTTIYDYKSNGYTYDNYFKTGNYFIWDEDKTASAEVILYDVITEHK